MTRWLLSRDESVTDLILEDQGSAQKVLAIDRWGVMCDPRFNQGFERDLKSSSSLTVREPSASGICSR